MYVCMYVRMCVCMYVCMYACMHVCMYACMYVYVHYVCMWVLAHPAIAVAAVQAFSTARCCVGGAGCATLHRDQRLADRLRARGLVRAARCAALLITSCSAL